MTKNTSERGGSIHVPYRVDESHNIAHFYENNWKRVAFDLLEAKAGSLAGMSLLDYGCGRGETLKYAKEHGMDAVGLDIDPECVRLSSSYGEAKLIENSHDLALMQEKSFDVVTCFHVLEHVENPKYTLTMLRRVAKRFVIVAVPNARQINNLLRPRREPDRVNRGHLQVWDHPHFRNLAEYHCGLEIVSWGFDATFLPGLSSIVHRTLGMSLARKLETGIFKRMFPYNGLSIIALMSPSVGAQ